MEASQRGSVEGLREHMYAYYGTDFGVSDDVLEAHLDRARAEVGERRLSVHYIAGQAIKQAYEGPKS